MTDDYPPARLRELADAEDIRHSIMWPNSFSKSETAAALRAAADQLTGKGIQLLSRTAQRDQLAALLARCEPFILACVTWSGDADECDRNEARALAAEIAAALKETEHD